ncbi:hypothetical protein PsorP6_009835 [Peronosclerospora sorghi]|uniref:Uncharacterized protein n=1 Tax=Peronosclerospora sorghi TaxID=230839 RepID=A0ACC0VZ53_9STRA|nr:hypothetical protein PsorP6_009835 [Peronosclerospora sorghi]
MWLASTGQASQIEMPKNRSLPTGCEPSRVTRYARQRALIIADQIRPIFTQSIQINPGIHVGRIPEPVGEVASRPFRPRHSYSTDYQERGWNRDRGDQRYNQRPSGDYPPIDQGRRTIANERIRHTDTSISPGSASET